MCDGFGDVDDGGLNGQPIVPCSSEALRYEIEHLAGRGTLRPQPRQHSLPQKSVGERFPHRPALVNPAGRAAR